MTGGVTIDRSAFFGSDGGVLLGLENEVKIGIGEVVSRSIPVVCPRIKKREVYVECLHQEHRADLSHVDHSGRPLQRDQCEMCRQCHGELCLRIRSGLRSFGVAQTSFCATDCSLEFLLR